MKDVSLGRFVTAADNLYRKSNVAVCGSSNLRNLYVYVPATYIRIKGDLKRVVFIVAENCNSSAPSFKLP